MEFNSRRGGDKSLRKWMWQLRIVLSSLFAIAAFVEGAQYFEEVPRDTSVVIGQTAVLKCVIGDRKGAVQWTKDGFSLGFNKTIPGFNRYAITDSYESEFNLRIYNAKLEDDAVYECQVLPRDGDERLQARATLTVLVPCEPPVILGYSNGSTVEIPFTQKTHELVCEARLGRPAATIEWFQDGVKIRDNLRYGIESSPDDKRETARSTLTINVTNYQNRTELKCRARNSAVFSAPLTTIVTLSILYPPGKPKISGYHNKTVNINDTLILTCISTGGNPPGTVSWYRNGIAVDWSFNTSNNGVSINDYTFRVNSSDNNAIYKCQVSNLVSTEPLTDSYTLKVNFPPTSVKISGAHAPVRSGTTITLTCITSNSNPKADITWFAKNQKLQSSDIEEISTPSPDGGYVTRSQIKIHMSEQDHGTVYTCQAANSEFSRQILEDTLTLSVLYPPSTPEITVYNKKDVISAGDLQRLDCQVVGGNPVPEIKWYKGDTLLNGSEYMSLRNLAISKLTILLKAEDNGAVYKCKAQNSATNKPAEAKVHLQVFFPPSHVTITVSPIQPRAGQLLDLICISSSSNPFAVIEWVRNGRRMNGFSLGTTEAENGGKNTTNRLQFKPTSKDHNAVYGCKATNNKTDQSVNDAVTLNVLFKPEFDEATLPDKVDVKKGDSTSLNLTAYANPGDVTYQLYKEGVISDLPSRFMLVNGILNISDIRKEDKGNYMIKANNSQGISTFNFSINVKYPAEIIGFKDKMEINEGEPVTFGCKVDANPFTPDIVNWFREDFDMSRARPKIEGDTAFLSINDLTREDSGTFKCIADNRIGSPVIGTVKLMVKFAPVINKSPEISRSAGEKGSTVSLKCLAQGFPDISFTWTRNNNAVQNSNKYKIDNSNSGLTQYESTLKVRDLEKDDYGAYVCTASNIKGSDSHSITLTGTSKPYPPYNIEFVNATSNSITLTWKPGFDGGLPQSFRVRYKPVDARGYVYIDVGPFGATTFKIPGLHLGTEYELTVLAFNDRGESVYQSRGITAKTSDVVSPADISTSELQGTDEIPVIIILVVCIVGVFILTLNVGLILFFIRRRKKRMEGGQGASDTTSHTNTFELYGNANKGDHTLYPAPSDDTRSYGTYDKSMDDFSDDYIRDYDRKHQFASMVTELEDYNMAHSNGSNYYMFTESDYPGSRPYSPHKIESPRIGGHKMTYIMDDHPGRQSPWNEDPYRVAHPRHKKGMYENGVPNGDVYEFKTRGVKGMNELSDRPPSRPSSRAGKTPPPPPTRSSSRGGFSTGDLMPPLPARNYEPSEISPQPRYGPTPGSSLLSPNIVANPTYNGPITNSSINLHHRAPSPLNHPTSPHNTVPVGAELRGHLV